MKEHLKFTLDDFFTYGKENVSQNGFNYELIMYAKNEWDKLKKVIVGVARSCNDSTNG